MPLDLTKPVQTRNGRPARILCTDRKHKEFPVTALVLNPVGVEVVIYNREDGTTSVYRGNPNPFDLVNVPEPHQIYLPDENCAWWFSKLESAAGVPNTVAVIKSVRQPKNFDPNKPVKTSDGRKARVLTTDWDHKALGPNSIAALVVGPDEKEVFHAFNSKGESFARVKGYGYGDYVSNGNLINEPEPVYFPLSSSHFSDNYASREKASVMWAMPRDRLKLFTVRVGEGL